MKHFKFISSLLLAFTLIFTSVPVTSHANSTKTGYVAIDSGYLNVRSKASTSGKVLFKLSKNAKVSILSKTGSWYHISYNGKKGYVSTSFITTSSTSNVKTGYVSVDSGALNVRSKASTSGKVLFKLSKDTKVSILSKTGSWYHISYNGKKGYVSASFISTKAPQKTDGNHIVKNAKKQLGKPYRFGSSGPNSFDCSGFVYYVMKESGVKTTRQSSKAHWNSVKKVSKPQPGDVVFFKDTYITGPSHMAIYIGNDTIIHANSGKNKIATDKLSSSYYKKHFLGYGRM